MSIILKAILLIIAAIMLLVWLLCDEQENRS